MIVYDQGLAEIIAEKKTVLINGEECTVVPNSKGNCDGCYFYHFTDGVLDSCPASARRICNSNGGNILKLVEPK